MVQVHEASWSDPELARFLHPDFAEAMAASTKASLGEAAAVITPSRASAEQVSRTLDGLAQRVQAVPHGVDLRLFRPQADAPTGPPYVLFVGVLHPRKNLAAVRHAAAALGLELVVVGSPPADRREPGDLVAQALAPAPGLRIRHVDRPPDDELAALYAGASAFCLPSYFEGFGLPALEAMASGVPVVVSDRGALSEVVGDAGVITSPDANAVTAALERAIADPDLGRAARARAEQFPWERTVDGWLSVLHSCA